MDKEINGITYMYYSDIATSRYERLHEVLGNPIDQEELKQLVSLVYKEAFKDGYAFAAWLNNEDLLG